jgi:Zn-finger protein
MSLNPLCLCPFYFFEQIKPKQLKSGAFHSTNSSLIVHCMSSTFLSVENPRQGAQDYNHRTAEGQNNMIQYQ